MRGRPRKSIATHRAEGTYVPCRHGLGNDPVLCGKPKKPRGLDRVASKLWDSVVPDLSAAGIVSEVDGICLADMCRWYSRYVESAKDWGDEKQSRLARAAWQEFASLACRFGMNPSDRARLRVAPEDTEDPLLKLMG